MRYKQVINRVKGTIETFEEDASVAASEVGVTVANMVPTVVSGNAVSVVSSSFSDESLTYQINFREIGSSVLKITTTFSGTDEAIVSLYLLRTLDDGSGYRANDYR